MSDYTGIEFSEDGADDDGDGGELIDFPNLRGDELELLEDLKLCLELLVDSEVASIIDEFIRSGMSSGDKLPPGLDLFGYIIPLVSDFESISSTEDPIFKNNVIEFIKLYRYKAIIDGDLLFSPRLEVLKSIGRHVIEDDIGGFVSDIDFSIGISNCFIPSSGSSIILNIGSEPVEIDISFSERLPDGVYIVSLSKYEYEEVHDEYMVVNQLALKIDSNGKLLNKIHGNVIRDTSELSLN